MNKKRILAISLIGLFAIMVIGLVLWLKPADTVTPTPSQNAGNTPRPANTVSASGSLIQSSSNTTASVDTSLAASLQGTEIDCDVSADAAGQLVLNVNIKRCFEYFLTQIGEKPLNVIDQQIKEHLAKILPATAAQQAIDLWNRYQKYRKAEGKLSVSGSNDDPDHFQKVFNALNDLRKQFFKPAEINALFGDEMTYNQYTIDRVNIMENKLLSPNQKAQKLKERFEQLPPDLQKNLQDISKLQDLRALTQEIKQKNGNATELRQMREQLVGAAAADRLEQLDQSRANWKTQVQNYLDQRQTILNSNQADQDKQRAITALRERQFSSEAERQRAITYEHFKDQGTNTTNLLQ